MFKRILLSLVCGSIAVFGYAPFYVWPLAFISFAGLLWLIAGRSKKQAMLLAFLWGVAYFLSGAHWVYVSIKQYGNLPTLLAIFVLALFVTYLALYPMLFAFLLRVSDKLAPRYSFKQLAIAVPLIWQLTEFLRSTLLNGFAWLQFGYAQLDSPLRGYFTIVGIEGVNLITSFVCGVLVYIGYSLFQTQRRTKIVSSIVALLLIFLAPIYFNYIEWVKSDTQRTTNIALVQGNITQSLRWNPEQLNRTIELYDSLTKDSLKNSDIIIWPEASITDIEVNQQTFLKQLDKEASKNNSQVAVGIIDYRYNQNADTLLDKKSFVYNTLLVLGDKKPYQYPTSNRYQKYHLVPFGEFTPLESLLKPLARLLSIPMSSMDSGKAKQAPLVMKDFKFTTAICYEVILSDLIWHNFQPDTDFLLTVSNDAWFGDSIGPWQHLQMAQARALEFGRPLIRSTNNGITAVIDHNGKIINQLTQFKTDVLKQKLSPSVGLTPYARWGNIPYFILLALMFLLLLFKKKLFAKD